MAYTYDDFLSAASSSGLLGEFSQADLNTAMKYPEFGLSILSLKKDYHNATTDEQRLLANEAANELRSSYGNYKGGGDGGSFYSQGKIPGQIDSVLDQINNYGSFSFDQEAPVYDNQYAQQQQALLDAILNREDFSWSKETDPQWSSYKKSYLREGERATANALAQASAASGGRASTAAITAASQAGDYYATQLNDVIPTLYQQAYDRYLNEYSMMLQDLGAVNTQEQLDYAKYLDQLGQYNTDRNFAYDTYLNGFNVLQGQLSSLQGQDAVDYNRYMDQINLDMQKEQMEYERKWNEDEREYNRLWNEDEREYNRLWNEDEREYNRLWNEDEREYSREWSEEEREYARQMDRAALLASSGDYSGYAALWGLSESQTKALVEQHAKEQGLSDRAAAMDLANFFAGFGDYSKAEEMGVDTSYMKALQQQELAGTTAGGGGSSGRSGGAGGSGGSGSKGSSGGSGGGSGTQYNNGSRTTAQIKEMQEALGVEADGYWGPATQAAAGGLSADAAWEIMSENRGGDSDGYEASMSDLNTASVLNLGLGPIDFDTVERLVEEGKVEVYQSGGRVSVRWTNGYNAGNYNSSPSQNSLLRSPFSNMGGRA